MAKALEYPVVFKSLLEGGHICAINFSNRNHKEYSVHVPNKKVGHITEKQFRSLIDYNLISMKPMSPNKDKYGNLYYYYALQQ